MWYLPYKKLKKILVDVLLIYIQVLSYFFLLLQRSFIYIYNLIYVNIDKFFYSSYSKLLLLKDYLNNITSRIILYTIFILLTFVFLPVFTVKKLKSVHSIFKNIKSQTRYFLSNIVTHLSKLKNYIIQKFISINKKYVYKTKGIKKNKKFRTIKALIYTDVTKYTYPYFSAFKKYYTRFYIKNSKFRFFFTLRLSLIVFFLMFGALTSILFYYQYVYTLPDISTIENYRPKLTSYFYDRNGNLLYKTYKEENRTLVKLTDLQPNLVHAVIATEDSNFYKHNGVSFPSIIRAAYANYKNKEYVQGGSTITQQLVKNILLTQEKTVDRKIKEALLAILIEQKFSKDKILEMYLNTVPFGGTAYGIEEASNMYFGKSAKKLTLAEASMLAGLPAAPSEYSPYIDIQKTKERQAQVLSLMVEQKYLTDAQADSAKKEKIDIKYPTSVKKYPHFIDYVNYYISQKYGDSTIQNGGLKIYTSIDPNVQNTSQNIVSSAVDSIKYLKISNGAALVLKNETGEVIAMVGSKDFYATDIDGFVNITTSLRQPGSSVKPFNYSLAFEKGASPATIVNDSPIVYKVAGSEPYAPKNYDGTFRGNVTIRRALANSLNIPSVKTLDKNGVSNFVEYIKKFGITTWDKDYYGLSLALGAAEIKMTEMANAYSVFANNGLYIPINPILYIENANGDIIDYNPCIYSKDFFKYKRVIADEKSCGTRVLSTGNSFLIKSILNDFNARREAFGVSILNVPGTAVKTGTTNDLKDNWAFGFNKQYTVSTWVGNNDNTPMSYVASGITGASPIWADIIESLTNDTNRIDISKEVPTDVVTVNVCTSKDVEDCQNCTNGLKEYFLKGTEPKGSCISLLDKSEDVSDKKKNKRRN